MTIRNLNTVLIYCKSDKQEKIKSNAFTYVTLPNK